MKTSHERMGDILAEERGEGYKDAILRASSRVLTLLTFLSDGRGLSERDYRLAQQLVSGILSDIEDASIPYPIKVSLRDEIRRDLVGAIQRIGSRPCMT